MGNQSTSGIVEEAKAMNEAPEKSQEVGCPDELKEEKQVEIQEDETRDFQEKTGETDCHDPEADKIVEEDHNGSVNEDCETRTDVIWNESNLEEVGIELNCEVQDQLCTLEGKMQNPILESTTITSLKCTPHEATEITSEVQEDDNMLEKEISDSDDDHDVETKEDGMDSLEDAVSEASTDEPELGKNDGHPKEEHINFNTLNDHQNVSFLEKQNECLALVEEKAMMNELGDDDTDSTSYVDREIEQSLKSVPIEEANEQKEDNEIRDESILEKVVLGPSKSRHIGVEVELRKSPSFDFGIAFDAKSEESDQTPLLYQDRTPIRSFSSCAKLRFQNSSVQTRALDMEEKTIRMERSNSMSPPQNTLNKEEIKANIAIITKDSTIAYDTKQEHSVSQSTSEVITRRNEKRKPRSSLFTTCICCTKAIS